MEEREICVRKNFSSIRDGRRIPIICNLIDELWQYYRAYDKTIGFYYMTNLLEVEAQKDEDPFYWEEDKFLANISEYFNDNIKKEEI